jgi:hypothetical protein
LSRPVRGAFQMTFRNSTKPPIERIVLIAESNDAAR